MSYDYYDFDEEYDEFDDYFDEMDWGEEDDEFLGSWWKKLNEPIKKTSGTGTTTRLRKMGLTGARAIVKGAGTAGGAALGGLAGGVGAPIGGVLGTGLGSAVASLIPQEMDELAFLAAETDDEAEAEAFIGALIPMAARLLPQAGGAIMRVAPQLIRGLTGAVRTLHGHPVGRQVIQGLGTVARRTGADIARQVAQGRPVSGKTAVRRMAHHASRVLSDPRQIRRARKVGRRRAIRRGYPRRALVA